MKRNYFALLAVVLLAIAFIPAVASAYAPSPSVALIPNTFNVAPGSTVDISVYMTNPLDINITMAAISTNIIYNSNVFAFDDESVVSKGDLLTHAWSLSGGTYAPGHLRVGGIDLKTFEPNANPWYESLAAGSGGSLFTFTLNVKADAPTGLSMLTWGVYDGGDNATAGFDYGDSGFNDVIVYSTSDASVNVVPIPPTVWLLGSSLVGLVGFRKRIKS
ncbi:MAG: hypothetical protein NT010_07435 [Proteobacteria bacterium]|nr:hypothetical protein [Pseudomonadota bacterium]